MKIIKIKSKSKLFQNKSQLKRKKTNHNQSKKKSHISNIWKNFGFVYHPLKKTYIRLGSTEAFYIIQNLLTRNEEWHKRVSFMANGNGTWANKMKLLLI